MFTTVVKVPLVQNASVSRSGVLTGGSQPVYNRVRQREPLFSRSPPVVFGFMSRPAKVNELIRRVQRKVKFTVGLFPRYWDSASPPSILATFARRKLLVDQFLTLAVKRSPCSDTLGGQSMCNKCSYTFRWWRSHTRSHLFVTPSFSFSNLQILNH